MLEKRRQVRVGPLVIDDKAGVDRRSHPVDGVTVPPEPLVLFE